MLSKKEYNSLKTPFEAAPYFDWESIHPTPQFKREIYRSLCGKWKLFVCTKKSKTFIGDITVPFAPESRISGINRALQKGEYYEYETSFSLTPDFADKRVIIHFGAIDQVSNVFVNGNFVCENKGGYLHFKADITDYLQDGENQLTIKVWDSLDKTYPYGKQRKNRGGMWYTPTSGIWQPVWLEGVPENYIEDIKISPKTDSVTISVSGGENNKSIILKNGERFDFSGDSVTLTPGEIINWTPENPYLYEFTLLCGEDKIESYFALREVTLKERNGKTYIHLNGEPFFFHGLLDQGYFADGIYTPFSPDGYIYDIKKAKSLGFNTLRKHIKIEPDIFYYYCDLYGMVVFQDAVNSGNYNFLIDTALPTIGIKKAPLRYRRKSTRKNFRESAMGMLKQLYNHPSVCLYTIFNEGWGQFDSDKTYTELKRLDPSRIYDTASGWFVPKKSDVASPHVYFKNLNLEPSPDKALILSEFGGYSCKIKEHSFNPYKTYGYKYFDNKSDFEKALDKLYREEVIPMIERGLSGAILTQLSDVEDETNGLVTYDRQVVKVDKVAMQKLADDVYSFFEAFITKGII